jgi:hypothetical protein
VQWTLRLFLTGLERRLPLRLDDWARQSPRQNRPEEDYAVSLTGAAQHRLKVEGRNLNMLEMEESNTDDIIIYVKRGKASEVETHGNLQLGWSLVSCRPQTSRERAS